MLDSASSLHAPTGPTPEEPEKWFLDPQAPSFPRGSKHVDCLPLCDAEAWSKGVLCCVACLLGPDAV